MLKVPYSWNPCCLALVFTEQFQKVISLCLRVLHRYVPWRLHGEQKHSISATGHVISAMGHVIIAMGHVIRSCDTHVGNLPLHWH